MFTHTYLFVRSVIKHLLPEKSPKLRRTATYDDARSEASSNNNDRKHRGSRLKHAESAEEIRSHEQSVSWRSDHPKVVDTWGALKRSDSRRDHRNKNAKRPPRRSESAQVLSTSEEKPVVKASRVVEGKSYSSVLGHARPAAQPPAPVESKLNPSASVFIPKSSPKS